MAYVTTLDIANRALQHLGIPRISALTNSSKQAREANFAIDKVRQTVLRKSVWTSATRRCPMRPVVVATTKTINFTTYSAAVTYATGDVVADSNGFLWISTKAANLASTPGLGGYNAAWVPYFGPLVAQLHDIAVAYVPGDMVYSGAVVYIAIAASTNQAPPNATYWYVVTSATATAIVFPYATAYENDGSTIRKVYRLPANFVRMAPQDPKDPGVARQNVAAGMQYNDWEVESGFLITDDTSGFVMRFVCDQADVTKMDPLLLEVWAAELALVLCEPMTQSAEKRMAVLESYTRLMNTAKMVNAIEAGTTEDEPSEAPPQPRQQGR